MTSRQIQIQVHRLPGTEDLPMPVYATEFSSGMDLVAAVDSDATLQPGERRAIPTGMTVAIPPGYEAQVRPRSGLAIRHGITMINAPGTIDADYRGEIQVLLINLGTEPFVIHRGDRIAQLVVAPVVQAVWCPVDVLSETERGEGGFGHTGI